MVSASDFTAVCNATIAESELCTPQTCCLAQGEVQYIPSLAGNSLFAAIFGLTLVAQLILGIRYKIWSFCVWMAFGLIGEIVGYIGRIMLNNNIFSFTAFLTYLVPLTIAPAFITASIYLCLARLIHVLDPKLQYSRLKPMTYTWIFVTFDIISLILQGAGGGVAATAEDEAGSDMGVNIMIAGLASQVASIVIFIALCSDFAYRLYRGHGSLSKRDLFRLSATSHNTQTATIVPTDDFRSTSYSTLSPNSSPLPTTTYSYTLIKHSRKFRAFIAALTFAVLFILIRSAYRLAELQEGFDGKLANEEVTFMILEGPMIILACLLLTLCHPGLVFRGMWSMKEFERVSAAVGYEERKLGMGSEEGLGV
ncbi:phospholipid-translocating ATPase rsb1 [Lithohypha guttulata]|nr:phospholipid-translocating ATPase rsb1 [Lithohypha guttulata]